MKTQPKGSIETAKAEDALKYLRTKKINILATIKTLEKESASHDLTDQNKAMAKTGELQERVKTAKQALSEVMAQMANVEAEIEGKKNREKEILADGLLAKEKNTYIQAVNNLMQLNKSLAELQVLHDEIALKTQVPGKLNFTRGFVATLHYEIQNIKFYRPQFLGLPARASLAESKVIAAQGIIDQLKTRKRNLEQNLTDYKAGKLELPRGDQEIKNTLNEIDQDLEIAEGKLQLAKKELENNG